MSDYLEPLAPPPEPPGTVVMEVRDLRTSFSTEAGVLRAVDNVSFDVCAGEVLGVVGESGCGKTVTAMSIMGLLPRPAGRIESGQILFKGDDLVTMKPR